MKLRLATPNDAPAIAAIYAPYVDTPITFDETAPDATEMASRIEKTLSLWPWLVAEDEGKVLGYAYASQHRTRASYRWAVDAGIYIDAAAHGRGVGRALYTSLIAMLRDQRFRTVYGGITLPNAKSIALHEAMGFQLIGIYRNVGFKNGAWRDVGWWGLDLGARDGVPAEPLPLAALDVARYLI